MNKNEYNKINNTDKRSLTSSTSYSTVYDLYFIQSLLIALSRSDTGLFAEGPVHLIAVKSVMYTPKSEKIQMNLEHDN